MTEKSLQKFVAYCQNNIDGDEKGEAQIFCDHFFMALGYEDGLKGAGADLEYRIRDTDKGSTSFADLVWPKKVLLEMKKSGTKLDLHLQQVKSYWLMMAGKRPRYIILCNFDEFWIYDFEQDVSEPADKIRLEDLPKRKEAFAFLLERPRVPVFHSNREDVTKKAAQYVATVFHSMQTRGIEREIAMRYCLQCVLAMFAEDVNLLPDNIFSRILEECFDSDKTPAEKSEQSYDLIGNLFREMNSEGITKGGRYRGVDYFNGGLFEEINLVELTMHEVELMRAAARQNWAKVNPAIFGSFFEAGMDKGERHIYGAHYTYESDIIKIVDPVIVQPWKKRIEKAQESDNSLEEYYKLLKELREFKVLDPACGSGNFLFVAYREMKTLEKELIVIIKEASETDEQKKRLKEFLEEKHYVSAQQFYGIDKKYFAVEVAKMTLMVAKELWVTEHGEENDLEKALPLDNLSENIQARDALVNDDGSPTDWPEADAIIGNPPFQSKRNMQTEFGADYVNLIQTAYPEVPGRADFCVFWFYKAHLNLKNNSRAGLVGTNTITQNYSREGSLDYILNNGGIIFSAVASQDWSGEAAVDVSIVNWIKGDYDDEKHLFINSNGETELHKVDIINSALTTGTDVSKAKVLRTNKKPKSVFQGLVPGHEDFLISKEYGLELLGENEKLHKVVKPHLIGNELVGNQNSQPERFIIDFSEMDINEASSFKKPFEHIEKNVLPHRRKKAEKQKSENKKILSRDSNARINKHHIRFFDTWWQLAYGRSDLKEKFKKIARYISCTQLGLRTIFEFISTEISPNATLMVFPFEDDYSFGVIQSSSHCEWWKARCSTLETRFRYTSNSIWNTFPWPQNPSKKQIKAVAEAAKELRDARTEALNNYNMTLRELYRLLEKPGKNNIRDLHKNLDQAVMEAYGFDADKDLLSQLLELNLEVTQKEKDGEEVQKPGLPDWVENKEDFISDDCVEFMG